MTNLERQLRDWGGEEALALAEPLAMLAANAFYIREQAIAIETFARDANREWPLRRLAALMLESALLRVREREERRFWIARFGMTDPAELRREGYSARSPIDVQLWRRLERAGRVHRLLHDGRWPDYFRASEHECRLTLARYLFTADEVIARIESFLRRSEGIPDPNEWGQFRTETARAVELLPAMERAIVEHLRRNSVMRWVSASTPRTIDALVAQPLGTVVVTIRPPGSTHEIQIKRAGRPRELPLDAVWKRGGKVVSVAHHLDGGSSYNSIAYEAEHGAFFSRLFREVHGADAAMSRSLTVARVDTLPVPSGEADLQEYFNTPALFGERFYEMRWNLYHSVRALAAHAREEVRAGDDGDLTREFIRRTKPAQTIQAGTTALRLDKLHRYLSPGGPDAYFSALGVAHDDAGDRRFADQLLDEILGVYEPPRVAWRSYGHYVESALRVPENRLRADAIYVSLLEQIGRFWGTLLAVRGHSRGESFVERNVGLRSVWSDGAWQVRIVFMDHDSLGFGILDTTVHRPRNPLKNAIMDADHILGGVYTAVTRERGQAGCLREIYRVDLNVQRRGLDALRAAVKHAYDRTHETILQKPDVAALFPKAIVPRLRDWDEAAASYLQAKTPAARERKLTTIREMLETRGYSPTVCDEYLDVLREEGWFLRKLAFLYEPAQSLGNAATTSSITRAPAGRSRPPMAVRAGQAVMPSPGSQSA